MSPRPVPDEIGDDEPPVETTFDLFGIRAALQSNGITQQFIIRDQVKVPFFVLDFRIESSRYKLAKVEMKDWVLILRRGFDFHHGDGQPFPAVILLMNPVDGRYFITVLAQVKR